MKKVLSLLLSVVMLSSITAGIDMSAFASTEKVMYKDDTIEIRCIDYGDEQHYYYSKNGLGAIRILRMGDTARLFPNTPPYTSDYRITGRRWSIGDPSIVAFTSNSSTNPATIMGISPGETTVTSETDWIWSNPYLYQYDSGTARTKDKIRVVGPVENITLSDSKVTLSPGQSKTISMKSVTPNDVFTKTFNELYFESQNPKVAKVDKNGKITAVASGTTEILACSKYGQWDFGYTSCKVTVASSTPAVSLSKTSYTYDGKVKKPSVTVKNNKGKKISSKYYTVSYSKGRKNVGKYTVTVKFKGNYSGTVKKTFTIKPKATTLSKVTAGKKAFTIKWKKQATQTTGYQIQYSTSSKFKDAKTVTVSKNKTTSKKISKLKSKKKYYVRVRTYKTVKINGKNTKIYSSWSKAKTVKTK